ncbi:hypothetical protein QTP88_014751 [Uroleucon formosanum]
MAVIPCRHVTDRSGSQDTFYTSSMIGAGRGNTRNATSPHSRWWGGPRLRALPTFELSVDILTLRCRRCGDKNLSGFEFDEQKLEITQRFTVRVGWFYQTICRA